MCKSNAALTSHVARRTSYLTQQRFVQFKWSLTSSCGGFLVLLLLVLLLLELLLQRMHGEQLPVI